MDNRHFVTVLQYITVLQSVKFITIYKEMIDTKLETLET